MTGTGELRVTFVIGTLEAGGAQRNLLWLCSRLVERGHAVTLITLLREARDFFPIPRGVTRIQAPDSVLSGIPWHAVSARRERWEDLRSTILGTAPNVVVSFIDTCNIYTLRALRGAGLPIIVSERNDITMQPLDWKLQVMRRLLYPMASAVVMVSRRNLDLVATMRPRWRARHIPNPVRVQPDADREGRDAPAWFGRRNLVAMGRLVPQKGFDLLLQAFQPVAERHPEWNLTIIGEGEERSRLLETVTGLNLDGRVTLTGELDQPRRVLRHADAFVLSSRYEGFPNALVEAMAEGVPSLSFDCPGGSGDIIRDGENGILVRPVSANALAVAIERIVSDDALRENLARASADVVSRFSEAVVFAQWLDAIDDALHGGR